MKELLAALAIGETVCVKFRPEQVEEAELFESSGIMSLASTKHRTR